MRERRREVAKGREVAKDFTIWGATLKLSRKVKDNLRNIPNLLVPRNEGQSADRDRSSGLYK